MSNFQVPRVKVKTSDNRVEEIPFTIARAHEVIARKCREDFNTFFRFMTGHNAAKHQREWFKSIEENKNVLIISPRGFGKTDWAIALLAWYMGNNPIETNTITSVSSDVAKGRLSNLKDMIAQPRYKLVFPWIEQNSRKAWTQSAINILDTRIPYPMFVQERIRIGNIKTHSVITSSPDMNNLIGNRISGLALIDDLHNDKHITSPELREKAIRFYESTYINCLIPNRAQSVIIGTRWANDDIIGFITGNEENNYHVVNIPAERMEEVEREDENGNVIVVQERTATFPEVYPLDVLDDKKRNSSPERYAADFLNEIMSSENAMFQMDNLENVLPNPLPEFTQLIISVDPAYTTGSDSDYTAIIVLAIDKDRNYYLLDLHRKRLTPYQLGKHIDKIYVDVMTKYGMCDKIIIEESVLQFLLVDKVVDETNLPIKGVRFKGNKETKATAFQSAVSYNKFHADWDQSWGNTLRSEMLEFPHGRHDDMVDAIAQAINYIGIARRPVKTKVTYVTL